MVSKADSAVFLEGDAIKQFLLGNKRVEAWFAANWERLDDMTGPINKSTVSRALSGMPIVEPVANAMEVLFDELRNDPWAWCKPPKRIDVLTDYAPLSWWYKTLKLKKAIPWSRFERMGTHPLKEYDAVFAQERLSEWRSQLKSACDQFKADRALVRALESDEEPEFQHWVVEDGQHRIAGRGDGQLKPFRRRVGNAGLHGRSDEEISMAWALADATLTLPNVEKATLTYSRPKAVPIDSHFSEPIEPWNGDEFEGIEIGHFEFPPKWAGATPDTCKVKHKVCFYWTGDRYAVEDMDPFIQVEDKGEWRDTTRSERDLFMTGIERKLETRAEFEARLDEEIERIMTAWRKTWDENPKSTFNGEWLNQEDYPDGPPLEEVVERVQRHLNEIDDEAAADEQREVARRKMAFMRRLRRR
ncbi:MAG: hypothetical protein ACRBB0_26765 [Pelagimonas sp.]|uniref:hypothetical protein n=1 Tax=Pelagimonas sp. TaxID=2073170 RepID=UPI003D6C3F13